MEGMIYTDDLKKVSKMLASQAKKYGELAEEHTDNEAIYGYFKGFEDASNIARSIIDSYSSAINCEGYVELCARISSCSYFHYAGDCNINPDFMDGFRKGRDNGGDAATWLLWLLKPDDWWSADKEETKDTDVQEDA